MRRAPYRDRAIVAVAALAALLAAEAVMAAASARVSYLAGGSVYVEAGRLEGLREGDSLDVVRNGNVVGRLRVAFLSSHRASCDTFAVVSPLQVGDEVRFVARPTAGAPAPAPVAAAGSDSAVVRAAPSLPAGPPRLSARPWRGRVGVRYLAVESSGGAGRLSQPALDLRVDGSGVGGLPLDLSADVRSRRTSWTRGDGGVENDGQARIYRMSALLRTGDGRLRATFGRQTSPAFAAVSLFDGALLESQGSRWSAGLFGGTQPEPVGLGLSSNIVEGGAFLGVRSRPGTARRWRMDLGGVSSFQEGQPNRDFLFLQASLQDQRLSGFATQEVDLNRGWKLDAGEPALAPTNTFLMARVQVVEPLAIQGGFDNRRNVRLYRDRATPETDFDDRYRQGAWGGATLDLWRHVRAGGDYRVRAGADRSDTWSGSAEVYGVGPIQVALRARFSSYRSDPTDSDLLTLALGLDPLVGCHLEASGGTRATRDRISDVEETVQWQSLDLDLALARRWYLTGSYERDQGELDETRQAFAGLSWRF